jgi:hypothetical protein
MTTCGGPAFELWTDEMPLNITEPVYLFLQGGQNIWEICTLSQQDHCVAYGSLNGRPPKAASYFQF